MVANRLRIALLVEARGQLAAHVEEVVELEDLDGEPLVHAPQLVVDEAVLDGRGRAGGHAAEEGELLVPVGRAPPARGPRPRTAIGLPALMIGQELEAERLPDPAAPGVPPRSGTARPFTEHIRAPRGAGRGPRASAVVARPRRARRAPRADLQLPHHDEERGVQDLLSREPGAERRGEVEQRDQLRHPLQERRLAALAPELVERPLVVEDDGRWASALSSAAGGLGPSA